MESQLASLKKKLLDKDPEPHPSAPVPIPLSVVPDTGSQRTPQRTPQRTYPSAPQPHVPAQAANPLESLIAKTQSLLSRVNSARTVVSPMATLDAANTSGDDVVGAGATENTRSRSPRPALPFSTIGGLLRDSELAGRPVRGGAGSASLADIELLVGGLPEAYETDVSLDDEALRKILAEGGPPPSQLQFPSLHAANQKLMSRLQRVDLLKINISRLLVFSAKFGVRLDDSFLIVRAPRYLPSKESIREKTVRVELAELKKSKQHNDISQKNSLKHFFVGEVALNKEIEFPIQVNDDLLTRWLRGESGIEIELYSYLAKPGPRGGLSAQPLLFAKATIALEGLLGTLSLDALVSVELRADAATHSAVMSRLRALHVGQQMRDPGSKLGLLSARIRMLEKGKEVDVTARPERVAQLYPRNEIHRDSAEIIKESPLPDKIETALRFVPEERPQNDNRNLDHKDKVQVRWLSRDRNDFEEEERDDGLREEKQQKHEKNGTEHTTSRPSFFMSSAAVRHMGIAMLCWRWEDNQCLLRLEDASHRIASLRISFRTSLQHQEEFDVTHLAKKSTMKEELLIGQGKVSASGYGCVQNPLFELTALLENERGMVKVLVARSRAGSALIEGSRCALSLFDVQTLLPAGSLSLIVLRGDDPHVVEKEIQKELDRFADEFEPLPVERKYECEEDMRVSHDEHLSSHVGDDSRVEVRSGSESERNNYSDREDGEDEDFVQRLSSFSEDSLSHNATSSLSLSLPYPREFDDFDREPVADEEKDKTIDGTAETNMQGAIARNADVVHVLDVSLYGVVLATALHRADALGCHVCYRLPLALTDAQQSSSARRVVFSPVDVHSVSVNESRPCFSLWWDSETALLNSNNRHRFVADKDACIDGVDFFLVDCDDDGALPPGAQPFAVATLSAHALRALLSDAHTDTLQRLPVNALTRDRDLSVLTEIVFKCSHHVEPALLRMESRPVEESPPLSHREKKPAPDPQMPMNKYMSPRLPLHAHIEIPFLNEYEDTEEECDEVVNEREGELLVVSLEQLAHLSAQNVRRDSALFFSLELVDQLTLTPLQTPPLLSYGKANCSKLFSADAALSPSLSLSQRIAIPAASAANDFALVVSLYERRSLFPHSLSLAKNAHTVRATDRLLGRSVSDLSMLARGMPLSGWYHIRDTLQKETAQIKVSVSVSQTKRGDGEANEDEHEEENEDEKEREEVIRQRCQDEDIPIGIGDEEKSDDERELGVDKLRNLLRDLESTRERLLAFDSKSDKRQHTHNIEGWKTEGKSESQMESDGKSETESEEESEAESETESETEEIENENLDENSASSEFTQLSLHDNSAENEHEYNVEEEIRCDGKEKEEGSKREEAKMIEEELSSVEEDDEFMEQRSEGEKEKVLRERELEQEYVSDDREKEDFEEIENALEMDFHENEAEKEMSVSEHTAINISLGFENTIHDALESDHSMNHLRSSSLSELGISFENQEGELESSICGEEEKEEENVPIVPSSMDTVVEKEELSFCVESRSSLEASRVGTAEDEHEDEMTASHLTGNDEEGEREREPSIFPEGDGGVRIDESIEQLDDKLQPEQENEKEREHSPQQLHPHQHELEKSEDEEETEEKEEEIVKNGECMHNLGVEESKASSSANDALNTSSISQTEKISTTSFSQQIPTSSPKTTPSSSLAVDMDALERRLFSFADEEESSSRCDVRGTLNVISSVPPALEAKAKPKSDIDVLQETLRAMQEQSLRAPGTRPRSRFPGRHSAFVSEETERVSKIMLGVFQSHQK